MCADKVQLMYGKLPVLSNKTAVCAFMDPWEQVCQQNTCDVQTGGSSLFQEDKNCLEIISHLTDYCLQNGMNLMNE